MRSGSPSGCRRETTKFRPAPHPPRAAAPSCWSGWVCCRSFSAVSSPALHAGLTYNTWPLMDGDLVPSGLLMLKPAWVNFFENITTVQFQHRCGAYLLLAVALWHWWSLRASGASRRLKWGAGHAVGAILIQAALGILNASSGGPLLARPRPSGAWRACAGDTRGPCLALLSGAADRERLTPG